MTDDLVLERDKYKKWFELKSKKNGELLAELSHKNVEIYLLKEENLRLRKELYNYEMDDYHG